MEKDNKEIKEVKKVTKAKVEKTKNLTLTEMKKQVKKLAEQTEHPFAIGEDIYSVKIDNVFRKTKQLNLLDDLVEYFDASNENADLLNLTTPYTSLLLIKHFTSIEVSDDIDEAIEMLHILIDLDLLNPILNSMPEDQVIEVYEVLSVTIDSMTKNAEEASEEAKRLSGMVKNKELKEMLENGELR